MFTDEEIYALRDSVSEETARMRRVIKERGQEIGKSYLKTLESLLSRLRECCNQANPSGTFDLIVARGAKGVRS